LNSLETTITQKGQVTIPVEIRTRLGLKARDKVIFEIEGNIVKLRRAPSRVLRGYGSIEPRRTAEILGERVAFEHGVAEEVAGED
jgi:AbrB family looped-hinge helix DNA binding protein